MNHRRLRLILSLSLMFLVFSLLPGWARSPDRALLTIFHVNDWHGTIAPSPAFWLTRNDPPAIGGPAVLSSVLRRLKLETLLSGGRYLFLDAGDRFQGSLEVNMSRGRLMTDLWKALGVMGETLGNHDFDYGQEPLWNSLRDSQVVTLCANLQPSLSATRASAARDHASQTPWSPSRIFDVKGIRIGLFGLITEQLSTLTYPENLAGLSLEPALPAARREIDRLRKHGADLVILLSHCGHDIDCRIASEAPGIDLIIGGHTDDHLLQPRFIGSTMIVQTRGFGSHLGVLDLELTRAPHWSVASYSYRNLALDPRLDPPDPDIEAIVASHARSLADAVERPIATLSVPLPKKGGTGESDFGALICRSIAKATRIPVAYFQAGGIRTDLPAGMIRFRDLYQALPFEHFLVTGELQGSDLIELAKQGPRLANHGISGNPEALLYVGRRVVPGQWYPVTYNDFLAIGGDSFPIFTRARNVRRWQETVRGVLMQELASR